MANETASSPTTAGAGRVPPFSEEAEKGVLGSILLDSGRVMDLCIERQIVAESFYLPTHRMVFEAMLDMAKEAQAIDLLTVSSRLKTSGQLDTVGGTVFLDRLIDSTPTAAHAEYYIDIVRQKHLLRSIISASRDAEHFCLTSEESADSILGQVEQSFLEITERQRGDIVPWPNAVKTAIEHVEAMFQTRHGLMGISTGFANLDEVLQGLKKGEMIVLAARPSMGKTSLAMGIVENVALGRNVPDRQPRPVGVFSLEMSYEALAMRMLCSHAGVSAHDLVRGYVSSKNADHGRLMQAASALSKAPILLDDTGGLDILELRARARRMKKKHNVELIVIDYLQLLHSSDFSRQGKQVETADISGHIKSMAKELKTPVVALSQLSRAPEQRDKLAVPKLSDLRDSGAIEQDADVVCMLRRPCKYPDDDEHGDESLAIVDVAKNRNGPTTPTGPGGGVRLNFEERFMRFRDRTHGVDGAKDATAAPSERMEAE